MAVKKTNIINTNTRRILKDETTTKNSEAIYDELKERANYCFNASNEIMTKISFVSGQEDAVEKEKEFKRLKKDRDVDKDIETIENFLFLSDFDVEMNIPVVPQIRHNYYYIKNSLMEIELSINSHKVSKATDKIEDMGGKLENIVGLIISVILSITIVTTSLSVLAKLDVEYIPLYIVSMVWLGMTLFAFCANLFNNKKFNKSATVLYVCVSFLELAILAITILYLKK